MCHPGPSAGRPSVPAGVMVPWLAQPPVFAIPGSPPLQLAVAPRLASRNAAGDPDQAPGPRRPPARPVIAAWWWEKMSIWRPGPGRTPVVRVHRGAPGRMRWPQAGPVPVSCSLARAPASRAGTSPMAGSWLAGSGSGRCALDLVTVAAAVFLLRHAAGCGQVGDDAVGAALGAARAGRDVAEPHATGRGRCTAATGRGWSGHSSSSP